MGGLHPSRRTGKDGWLYRGTALLLVLVAGSRLRESSEAAPIARFKGSSSPSTALIVRCVAAALEVRFTDRARMSTVGPFHVARCKFVFGVVITNPPFRHQRFIVLPDTDYAVAGVAAISTRDASRPTPISRARAHPPPIDVGIQTSGLAQIPSEGPAHQDPTHCADAHRCNESPTPQDRTQVRLGHRDHPVQALPPNRSDHTLADRVRLRARER